MKEPMMAAQGHDSGKQVPTLVIHAEWDAVR